MSTLYKAIFALLCAPLMFACSSSPTHERHNAAADLGASSGPESRAIIRSASVDVEVDSVDAAASALRSLVDQKGGYISSSSSNQDDHLSLVAQVPSPNLDSFLDRLDGLGKVTSTRLSSRDVTDEIMDIEARLANLKKLRDRFRELLNKAESVEDILRVERELARVQTDIDAIEARKKNLDQSVELSTVHVNVEQKTVLGPLGYAVKGVYWAIKKLFVLN